MILLINLPKADPNYEPTFRKVGRKEFRIVNIDIKFHSILILGFI
jgi:hypothetical protein